MVSRHSRGQRGEPSESGSAPLDFTSRKMQGEVSRTSALDPDSSSTSMWFTRAVFTTSSVISASASDESLSTESGDPGRGSGRVVRCTGGFGECAGFATPIVDPEADDCGGDGIVSKHESARRHKRCVPPNAPSPRGARGRDVRSEDGEAVGSTFWKRTKLASPESTS